MEQILLRSMYYFRSIFQRSNYCRRSKCHTFGMFGAYFSEAIVAEQLTPEQMSPEQLSAEQLSPEQMSRALSHFSEQLSAEHMSLDSRSIYMSCHRRNVPKSETIFCC